LLESIAFLENIAFLKNITFLDSIAFLENIAFLKNITFLDSIAFLENIAFLKNITFLESIAFLENIAQDYGQQRDVYQPRQRNWKLFVRCERWAAELYNSGKFDNEPCRRDRDSRTPAFQSNEEHSFRLRVTV
jgi:hypothetical protein